MKTIKPKKPFTLEAIHLTKGDVIEITHDMIIGDVVLAYPETLPVLQAIGIHCVGCYASTFESIGEGVVKHGMDPAMVCKKLNAVIKKHHQKNSQH